MNLLKRPVVKLALFAMTSAILFACAQPTHSPERAEKSAASVANKTALRIAHLEIRYRLGHDWYRIAFLETDGVIKGSLYEDDHLLRNATIPGSAVTPLTDQAKELQTNLTRVPAATLESVGCSQPFEISYWNDNQTKKTQGCREKKNISQRLSRLIRESELLIYSQSQ